jgi:lipoic acid synthetase
MSEKHLPFWMHRPLTATEGISSMQKRLKEHSLESVCEHALCPNRPECYAKKRATFLALGKICTRSCAFCHIASSKSPEDVDPQEGERIACLIQKLQLQHVVVTMVTRDDLPDGGASHMAAIVRAIRKKSQSAIEVLTSDFCGNLSHLDLVLQEKVEIFNHNLETVKNLTPKIRSSAQYERSLSLLRHAKHSSFSGKVKSGLMVGLGETKKEVLETLEDLASAGCDIVTIGQYLQPSKKQMEVKAFIPPELFLEYEKFGLSLGIKTIFAGPYVRSSYCAGEILETLRKRKEF